MSNRELPLKKIASSSVLQDALGQCQQSHLKYKPLIEFAPDAIIAADTESGIVLEANNRAADMFGIPVDRIIGMQFLKLHPDEDRKKYSQLFQKASRMESPFILEDIEVCSSDGEKIPVQITASLIQIGDKQVISGFFRDISELQSSQKRFQRLAEATFEGIVIHDNGVFVEVNQQFADMFGYSLEELKKLNGLDLFTPESRTIAKGKIASKDPGPYEATCLRKDGSTFPVEIRARSIHLEGRQLRIAACRDMTQLKQQQEQLKAVFESSPDHIIVVDKNYTHLYINQSALETINLTPEEAGSGKTIDDALGHIPDLLDRWKGRIDEVFRTEETMRVEDDVLIGDQQMYIESILSPIRYPSGNMFAVGILARDVTEQKKLQQQLAESEERYKDLYRKAQIALFRTRISDGKMLDCSLATSALLGYTNEAEFLNLFSVTETYVDPKQRNLLLEALKKNKRVQDFHIHLKRKDGSHIWVSISAEIFPEQGYLEGVMQDISVTKTLSNTEKTILDSLMQGMSNKEIAFETGRAVRTIEDHRANIMRKLEVDNIVELTQKALKLTNHHTEK